VVSLDQAVVARLDRHGIHFELLVEPEGAQEIHRAEEASDEEVLAVLAVEAVFLHAREGERASKEELEEAFETTELAAVARRILREGEIQLTQEQRKSMAAAKYKRIIDTITRNGWNPQTKTPHPKDRIERALAEAKFHVDPLKGVQEQVNEAMKKLRPLIPIAFEQVKIAVKVPPEYTGPLYGHLRSAGELLQEEWQKDGSLVVVLEIPAGAQGELYDRLNGLTHGSVETKLLT
jgi:ribosome maturation protein SDO1